MFTKKQPTLKSLIAAGTRIEGDVQFSDGLRIDGQLIGNIEATTQNSSILVISESANVQGQVKAEHVIISGTVKGPIYANKVLELHPKAVVEGDVFYKILEMHSGAIITGKLVPHFADHRTNHAQTSDLLNDTENPNPNP